MADRGWWLFVRVVSVVTVRGEKAVLGLDDGVVCEYSVNAIVF